MAVTIVGDGGSGAGAPSITDGYALPGDDEPEESTPPGGADPVVTFLPALDPTPMGWKERGWYLGPHGEFGGALFDRNGNVGPTIWVDGGVVGGWGQRPGGEVAFTLLEPVPSDARELIANEAESLTEWLGGEVVMPRFPTPLQRELAC